ncbi:MAG: LysR family transcriptional regulator [Myxococcota bacterium]
MDWDDLKYVLAIEREGSLGGAARLLNVAHSTVARRLKSLESKLQAELFERRGDRLVAASGGQELADVATQIERLVATAEGRVVGSNEELSGDLHITTVDALAIHLAGDFESFSKRYPSIDVHLSVTNELVDISKREADVAIRGSNGPPAHLVGRRAGRLEFAAFAHRSLGATGANQSTRPWLLYQAQSKARMTEDYVVRKVQPSRVPMRVDSAVMMMAFVREGIGIGILPVSVGRTLPDVEQLGDVLPGFGMDVWVLTHPDLRRSSKVRAALEHFSEAGRRLLGQ